MQHSSAHKIYSFDVFETCVIRPYVRPEDLFLDAASLAQNICSVQLDEELTLRIADMRKAAEKIARRRLLHSGRDLTLDDIYSEYDALNDTPVNASALCTAELKLEVLLNRPVLEILDLVMESRRNGKVVFSSDMYLPRDTVVQILLNAGYWQEGDTLYLSSEIDKTKFSTALYHHIIASESVMPSDVFHIGDNYKVDYQRARLAGIKAAHFRGSHFNAYERFALQNLATSAERDALGLIRAIRLSRFDQERERDVPGHILYSVVAPLLTAYVAWILDKADKEGVARLYFVSRDGQVLYEIARVLAQQYPGIELRYLYGSRQAWMAASVCPDDFVISWAFKSGFRNTPSSVFKRLGLSWIEVKERLRELGYGKEDELLDQARVRGLKAVACDDAVLKDLILARAAEQRGRVMAYFEQEGLADELRWALVDVGWELNTQSAVKRILKAGNCPRSPAGFYLGVYKSHVKTFDTGGYYAYFAQPGAELGGEFSCDWFFERQARIVIEHLFTVADHASVTGYELMNRWGPTLNSQGTRPEYLAFAQRCHEIARSFASEYARSNLGEAERIAFMSVANQLLKALLSIPQSADVDAVAWLPTFVEQASVQATEGVLASPLDMRDILRMIGQELGVVAPEDGRNYAHSWLEGGAAISPFMSRLLFRGLRSLKRFINKNR